MELFDIEKFFKDRKGELIGKHRKNSVIILLSEINGEMYVNFEVRSEKLRHQPGDVCLPGGRVDEGETPREAVIREVIEELNVSKDDFEVYGEMDYVITPYKSIIYPYVGVLKKNNLVPSQDEVDHMFRVPLKYFMEEAPIKHTIELGPIITEEFPFELIRGGKNYSFNKVKQTQHFYKYKDYVIWGFTARIIYNFVRLLKGLQE